MPPWDENCLAGDMSCGHEFGMAVENGKYGEFLQRFPNYRLEQELAYEYWSDPPYGRALYKEGDTPEKRWIVYVSKNLFATAPVGYAKEEFLALPVNNQYVLSSMEEVLPSRTLVSHF
ncbi:MAG: hypothetical protein K0U19_06155 [Proteobacteria bacterium]|nr:hypothetical protein [Pseudomonadota bacterium]